MAIEVTPPSPAVPTKSNSQDGPMFSMRIVNLEYYLSPPLPGMDVCYSKFQGRTVTEVPVVRIYGSTPAGQKACLHLHQVFPYFYVPYDEDLPQDTSDALAYVRCLASAIEKAMKLASSNAAKKQHVHSCSLVRARRYYGYYPSEQLFIKIVLYHPQEVARISTLLLGGGIMNRKFQPHESHISYLLQLLIDQNLAGMSYIHLSSVKFRRPIPERPSDTMHVIQQLKAEFTPTAQRSQENGTPTDGDANRRTAQNKEPCSMETTPPTAEWIGTDREGRSHAHSWVESSIPTHWVWPSHYSMGGPFGRHSTCELEFDATVEDILNRQELALMPLHEAGPAIKLVQSLTPMWEEERLRTGEDGPAGAAAALRPSPDRFLPPPSALEQALRDSLFQIVQDEERFQHFEPKSDQFLKSTQEVLLECSQAANVVRSEVEQQELEPRLDTKSIGVQGWPEDDGGGLSGESRRSQGSEDELVNEHIIRSQLTPQGQEAEDEVAELLEWMGASQEHDMGASDDEVDVEALEIGRGFSQSWESPTMEAAMLQALSKFEQATQKECQEILDCVNNDDCEEDDGDEDLEAALLEIDLEDVANVQRDRRRLPSTIPQVDGASDACEIESSRHLFDRYIEHLNTLNTGGLAKDSHVIFGVDETLDTVQNNLEQHQHILQRIPQNDGADDDETESDFAPEPKRTRHGLHRSTTGSKKDSRDRKEKDIPKRPMWGLLPLVGGSSQPTNVKQEKKEQRVSKRDVSEAARPRNDGNFRARKEGSRVVEVAGRGQRMDLSTDEKSKASEVSLRALMRKKRERRLRSKESSVSGGSSIVGSQSEGEQSFGGMGIVKSESSLPDDSESQEQQNLALSGLLKLAKVKDEEDVEVTVTPSQRLPPSNTLSRYVTQISKVPVLPLVNRDAEPIARSSQDVEIGSGRRTTLQQIESGSIYPVEDIVDESESRSTVQRVELSTLPLKIEDSTVKWDYNLHESGDHRDCGGGENLHAETGDSMSIQVQYQIPAEEDMLGEGLRLTQPEEANYLLLSPTSGRAGEIEDKVESEDLDAIRIIDMHDIELVEVASLSWAEVVKEITSAKVNLRNIRPSSSDVNLSQDIGNAMSQRNARSGSMDVVYLVGNLPSEVLPSQRLRLGSDEVLEDGTHVMETQLVEHEILWRLKQDEVTSTAAALATETIEDEFIGTILVEERQDLIDDRSQANISKNHNAVLVTDKMERSPQEEIKESPPKLVVDGNYNAAPIKEGSEAAGLLFTDMSDFSEDSFDWGDEFGSSHKLDDSDEGAYASEEEGFRARLPPISFGVKPELPTHLDGVAPALEEPISKHGLQDAVSEAHLNFEFVVEAHEAQQSPATTENMNTTGVSTITDGAYGVGTRVDAVLGEEQATEGASKDRGETLKMFSAKSSSQARLGVGISNLSSGTDYDKLKFLRPTDGQPESTDVNFDHNEDENERESEAVFDKVITGKSECKSSSVERGEYSGQEAEGEITIPFKFYQKPPSRQELMDTLGQYNLRDVDYGGVFYGNSKDVPGRATVSAGLIFDVKSRDALDLPPFLFGAENKKSRFSVSRAEQKAKSADIRPGMGVPCHYENDGSVSYLLTPAKPPPSRLAVEQWLSENHVSQNQNHSGARGERVFTMDANTGKLVPIDDAGSNRSTQESLPMRHSGEEDMEYFRPASPKYDEKHVLATPMLSNLPASPAYALSSKRSSRRSSDADAIGPPGTKSLHPNPLLSSGATTSVNTQNSSDSVPQEPHMSKSKLQQTSSQDEKNVYCTPPQLAKDEVKIELPTEKLAEGKSPKDIPKSASRWRDVSQITAPSPLKGQLTPLSQSGFRDPASVGAGQQITLMSIEVHSETRGNLRPDPRYDAVGMVVVDIQYDDETRGHLNNQTLVLLVDANAASSSKIIDGVTGCSIIYLADELLLLKCFVRLVRLCDPDMLVGWEVQGSSLGLLAERAANLGFGLLKELSRTPPKVQTQNSKTDAETDVNPDPNSDEGHSKVQELRNSVFGDMVPLETGVQDSVISDEWGRTNGSGLFVGGRIILNLWRIMRGEVKLGIYTLEAVAEAVLRKRVPRIPWRTLTRWFARGPAQGRYRCIEYFVERAKLNFEIMDQLDLLNRTAELARVFGIDFYSVFSRGSQYRVESMMLRLARTQNFLLLSPSRQQVAAQPAMECLPLVMEPESRFYTSPVVVLDFQSLYPSMIIAYNLCFSTCLGKIVSNNPKVLGVTNLPIPPRLLQELKDLLTITPNGVMYTPPEVRQGVVPRLLSEILSTRIMVKQAMKKLTPDQRVLQRVLNARQFALKLIANVTYGYTAAGFSGRMPCAELADSIVQCGRLTLERAIHLVNTTKRWDARVVYGDTDSMFVHLEGRTREEAFKIGQDIAASVTAMNPNPVTLKMEKVYHPCVLLTKKRYVGYSYESPGQATPIFDAKGIETIRRDSCAAVAKTLERSLRTLFETQDLSQVKAYLQRQWGKIVSGRVSLRDFVFAKEVRLGTYSARASVLPAAAIVASKAMSLDPRAEPRYAERVPYVVVHGEPGARLSDVVVDPHTMLANGLRLHDTYYITKQIIPALQRIFGLVGADLKQWYAELPRVYRPPTSKRPGKITSKYTEAERSSKGATIDHYYLSQHCSVCGELMRGSQLVCTSCSANPQAVVSMLTTQTAQLEMEFKHLEAICRHCGGGDGRPEGHIACVSLDCPIFFERLKVQKELQALSTISANCGYYPTCFLDFGSELF
ncbi:hypothetical protein M758_9G034000 [Ceratodon purpureus]|nr:hypothetical protein M758_9G034000 [Ceratodon purpureus]